MLRRPLCPLLLALACLLTPASGGARDGALTFRTIDTPHFQLHYPEGLEAVAFRSARLCEEAHQALVPLLRHVPTQRTQVSVSDFGDQANGSATALPYLKMNLYAAPPTLDGNLNDYDDWLRLLVFHEYTHILHLDTVSGLPDFLNKLFGKTYAPNQNMPSFMLEGTAVFVESLTSRRGRIHSASFRAWLRLRALSGTLFGLDEVTHAPLDFPNANVWYMYGGHFIDWVARNRSVAGLARMNAAYGNDLIPFALQVAATEGLGQDITTLWQAWQADLTAKSRAEAAAIQAEGPLTPWRMVTTRGRRHERPAFLPDGTLLALESDGESDDGVYRRDPATDFTRRSGLELDLRSTESFDVCRGADRIVLDQNDRFQAVYSFNDLYVWDRAHRVKRRATRGQRLREPSCAPGGRWAAAVQLVAGRSRLVRVDLQDGGDGEVTVLHDPGGINQMAFPAVSGDGRSVVATRVTDRGRGLVAVDVESGALRVLEDDGALALHAVFSPDGRHLLYSSDRSGVFEAYARAWPDGPTRRLTRSLGGALDPALAPDGRTLVVSLITEEGQDLATAPVDLGLLPAGAEPLAELAPEPTFNVDVGERPLPTRPFAPGETLWPVSWSPKFAFSSPDDAAQQLGLTVEATDAINRHVIVGDFATAPAEESYTFNVAYLYRRFAPAFGLNLSRTTRTATGAAFYGSARRDVREDVTTGAGSVSFPFSRSGHGASGSLRYATSLFEPTRNPAQVHDPLDPAPITPAARRSADLSMSVRYSSSESWLESISGEDGRELTLTFRVRNPLFGSDFETAEIFGNYVEYWDLWWRHVLAFRLNAGFGAGETGRRVLYALGGVPENRTLLLDALDQIRFGGAFLRGYPSGARTGDHFVLGTLEYRMPVADIFRGFSTVPAFMRRISIAAFTDWGQAREEALTLSPDTFSRSLGGELSVSATLGWRLPIDARIGYAHGFDAQGEEMFYFFAGNWF